MKRKITIMLAVLLLASIGLNAYLMFSRTSPKATDRKATETSQLYTCGMHPEVIQEGPGTCPICGMDLVPLNAPAAASETHQGERKVAYWVAPMDPNYISDKPGKSPMGMDLVPVYEDELRSGVVKIDPVTLQNIGVTTTLAERRDLSRTLRTNGIVMVAENAEYRINPKISGWIEKLYVSRTGDLVRKGDPLLDIYSPELVAAQEEYLLAAKSAGVLASSGLERVSSGGQDLLESARRRLELWDITDQQIKEIEKSGQVRRTMTLYSPADGIVLHKEAIEGAAVKPGMDLFKIASLDPIWVEAQVFEYELPWVRKGDKVEVFSSYDPNVKLQGRVDYIYPYLDSKSRTANVRIVLHNPKLTLRPDMYVDARILTVPKKGAIAVPKRSVIRSGERNIVFVALGNGQFLPREVKLGVDAGPYFEILEGLSPGTAVVTSAQFLLDSEAKLQEAIQRRLQQRKQAGGPSTAESPEMHMESSNH